MSSKENICFGIAGTPGFCSNCGSILPTLGLSSKILCFTCKAVYGPEVVEGMESFFTLHFNSYDKKVASANKKEKEVDGPVVERKCLSCGHDKMYYATLQLRSADEGQTVFYTCTKCRYKETENS